MKKFEEDKKLEALIKNMKPDSPGNDFAGKVMNRIFEMESLLEKVKNERIFGKGFWIITSLFVVIIGVLVATSVTGLSTGSESEIAKLLPDLNTDPIANGYQTAFQKISGLPLSIAGILLASSMLVLIDRVLFSRNKIKSKQ
jgi:hypothetical protein